MKKSTQGESPLSATVCSPSSDTPIMDAAMEWQDKRDLLAAIGNLERDRRRFASQLQTLCDMIIGGQNVLAPFCEVEERLRFIISENYEARDRSGSGTPTNPNEIK